DASAMVMKCGSVMPVPSHAMISTGTDANPGPPTPSAPSLRRHPRPQRRHPRARPGDQYQHNAAIGSRVDPGDDGPGQWRRNIIMKTEPARMTTAEASALIQPKKLSCEELTRSCLARIRARDPMVKAWLSLDPDHVVRRARELDKLPSKGPLHGIPWGVKDVIDSADYPTTQNSAIYDGLKVGRDAAAVAVIRGS